MVATTAHLPFPVCDGDALGGAPQSTYTSAVPARGLFDIDFVLLGCDLPDDFDDGPFDDDPDDGNIVSGPFPTYLRSRTEVNPLSGELLNWMTLLLSDGETSPDWPDDFSNSLGGTCSHLFLPTALHVVASAVIRC